MREIKLRSYNKESGKFFYFCNGRYYSNYRLSCCVSERVCPEFQWNNADKYTGLKDKNGKEIYEEHELNNKYGVRFEDGCYILYNISNGDRFMALNEVIINGYGLEITREYTQVA